MTVLDERPINGHPVEARDPWPEAEALAPPPRPAPQPPVKQTPQSHSQDENPSAAPATFEAFTDMPSRDRLDDLITRASQVVEVQDADVLSQVKGTAEINASRRVAAKHRAALLKVQEKRNQAEVKAAERKLKAEIRRQDRERQLEEKLADAELRDQLDATEARHRLKRLADPVSYLAAQIRSRRLAMALGAAPAVVAVTIGAVQSQDALARLWNIPHNSPLWWLLFGLEPLATLPLVAIMLYTAASAVTSSWSSWRDMRDQEFFHLKLGLLMSSIAINVMPHMALGEISGVGWVAVPLAIVVSLSLLPKLSEGYNDRIAGAKTEAELGAPAGVLVGEHAKLIRQLRWVQQALIEGRVQGEITDGVPSASAILRVLREKQGTASKPDAQRVRDAMRLLHDVPA